MGLTRVFRSARGLGDLSSLEGGRAMQRLGTRAVGRAASRPARGLEVHNLFMWGAFLGWVNNQIKLSRSRDVFIVNAMRYAWGYEYGFTTIAKGRRMPPPGYGFFRKGMEDSLKTAWQPYKGGITMSRSGLYIGGRFAADVRAVAKGRMLQRSATRLAGRETTRLVWGTLANPKANPMESIAKRAVANIRRNIRSASLVDTAALAMATQYGSSREEAFRKSRAAAKYRLMTQKSRHDGYSDIVHAGELFRRKIA
jgi:hypothetical protein